MGLVAVHLTQFEAPLVHLEIGVLLLKGARLAGAEGVEVFFDARPARGIIARVLWEYVEVHIALSDARNTSVEDHVENEPAAVVMNAVGRSALALSYRRLFTRTTPVFGNHVPFDRPWSFGEEGAVLEARGPVIIGGELVKAARYGLSVTPDSKERWLLTLSPLPGQRIESDPVTLQTTVDTGGKPVKRLELFYRRDL